MINKNIYDVREIALRELCLKRGLSTVQFCKDEDKAADTL